MAASPVVLIVDDEADLRQLVRPYLQAEGISVLEAASGPEGLCVLQAGGVDLAVVDVMLPGFDGFELLKQTRRFSDVPVIMLTARREEDNRIAGLRHGADDYVLKPFSVPELAARVMAQLRRARGFSVGLTIQIGAIEIDADARTVRVDGADVELTRREFDLLWALASNAGRALSRPELLRAAWEASYFNEKTVDVHVAGLRRKLGDALEVTAVRGIGYRMEKP